MSARTPENVIPEFLVRTTVGSIPLYEWLAVLLGLPLAFVVTTLLDRAMSRLATYLRRRVRNNAALPNLRLIPVPVRLLLIAWGIRWILARIALPSLLARQFWSITATLLTITGCVWLAINAMGWCERHARQHLRRRSLSGPISLLRLVRGTLDVLAIFVGIAVALHFLGVNPTAALAGLGVGGIAVALAAQKTLENVISGVSLALDGAVRVGDVLRIGDVIGTVMNIGLRSTRIRTLERTVLSIPNAQIGTITLDNLSSRDKFWFHHLMRLRSDTTAAQMRAVLTSCEGLLASDWRLERDSVRARFLSLGTASLDVEMFAYVRSPTFEDFLHVQEELLLGILDAVEGAGAVIALPSQALYFPKAAAERLAGVPQREDAAAG